MSTPHPPPAFTLGTLNTQSNLKNSCILVVEQLIKHNVDICAIQDTGPSTHPKSFLDHGYNIISRPPPANDKNGGLALVYKSSLTNAISPISESAQPKNSRVWILNCEYPKKHRIIIAYNKSRDTTTLQTILNLSSLDSDILLGDLNSFPSQHMDQVSSANKPAANTRMISTLLDNGWTDSFRYINPSLKAYSRVGTYHNPITGIPFYTATRIDHILIRADWIPLVNAASIIEADECDSDHRLVLLNLRTDASLHNNVKGNITFRPHLKDKTKWNSFTNTLPPPPLSTGDINEDSDAFAKIIVDHFNKTFPEKTIPIKQWHKEVYSTGEYLQLKKTKKLCYKIISHIKKTILSGAPPNHTKLTNLINLAKPLSQDIPVEYNYTALAAAHANENNASKAIRRLLTREKRKFIKKAVEKIIEQMDENGHNMFKLLKGESHNLISCIFDKGRVLTHPDDIHSSLQKEWEDIFTTSTPPNTLFDEFLDNLPTPKDPPPKPNFSAENITRHIKNKQPTAPGISKVSWKMLKHTTEEYATHLSQKFTSYHEQNVHPDSWFQGITTLIPKPNTPPTPGGFRPITLLSVEYKLYTIIINETILKWAFENNIVPPSQNGALADRGCDTCLWNLISTINECNKQNHPLHVYFIDYSKAFDSVEHWVLEKIFKKLNLGSLSDVLMTLLKRSSTQLKVNNQILPTPISITKGTKQGDGISPLLFILFMAPLLWKLEKDMTGVVCNGMRMKTAAIMDDVAIATDNLVEAAYVIETLKKYSKATGIQMNPKKSAYAHKNDLHSLLPIVNNIPFEDLGPNKSYRYLGVWLNLNLDWSDLQEHLLNQIRTPLNIITSKFYISPSIACKLINATVMATIGYRMQVILFETNWLSKVERLISGALNKRTKVFPSSHAVWSLAYNLKSLTQLNYERYSGSLWRTMQIREPSYAQSNLVNLLSRPPKPISIHRRGEWMEPQDVLASAKLSWFHKDLIPSPSLHQFQLPPLLLLAPHNDTQKNVTVFSDGSLQHINEHPHMAASLAWLDGKSIGWPIHGPPSSTEAEIQGVCMAVLLHPDATTINIVLDSKCAIDSIFAAAQARHTNLHKFPNRVSLRYFNEISTKWEIRREQLPAHSSTPTINLIHIYGHSKEDKNKYEINKSRFAHMTDKYVALNDLADAAAKNACKTKNHNHHPLLKHSDALTIFPTHNPQILYTETLRTLSTELLHEQFNAKEPTKAKRWLDKCVDLQATVAPLRSGNRGMEVFSMRLLYSTLPTKPTVRRSKWFSSLPADSPKRLIYANDLCNTCNIRESHKHIFDECPAATPLKEQFVKDALQLIRDEANINMSKVPWWFGTPFLGEESPPPHAELRHCRKDLGWRGFIPNILFNTLIKFTSSTKADKICKSLAIKYADCNLKIWKRRCDTLYNRENINTSSPQQIQQTNNNE